MKEIRLFLSLVLMIACLSPSAHAQAPEELEEFETLMREGQAHLDGEEYGQAIEAFEQAEALFTHPMLSARIAYARAQQGYCQAARQRLVELEAGERTEELDEFIDRINDVVTHCYSVGSIVFECEPSTAKVFIDSIEYDCGAEIELEPGDYRATIAAEGYKAILRNAIVRENQTRRVTARLFALHDSDAEETDEAAVAELALPPAAFPYQPVGLGAMALGVSLVGVSIWVDSGATARQELIMEANAAGQRSRVDELEAEAQTRRTQALILFASGSVLAAAGLTSFVIGTFEGGSSEDALTLMLLTTPAHVGLSIHW